MFCPLRTIPLLKVGHTLPPGGLLSYFFGVTDLLFARPPRGSGLSQVESYLRAGGAELFLAFPPLFSHMFWSFFPELLLADPPGGYGY